MQTKAIAQALKAHSRRDWQGSFQARCLPISDRPHHVMTKRSRSPITRAAAVSIDPTATYLRPDQLEALIHALGYRPVAYPKDQAEELEREVNACLHEHKVNRELMDGQPRAPLVAAELEEAKRTAQALLDNLGRLSDYADAALGEDRAMLPEVQSTVERLHVALDTACARLGTIPSKGAPKKRADRELLRQLALVFERRRNVEGKQHIPSDLHLFQEAACGALHVPIEVPEDPHRAR